MQFRQREDYSGLQVNDWTIQSRPEGFHDRGLYQCLCVCGVQRIVNVRTILQGKSKSCGCSRRSKGNAALLGLFARYKGEAKRRGLEFSLTLWDFEVFTSGDCVYCGTSPNKVAVDKGQRSSYQWNGIDRIDPRQGYTVLNSQSCCSTCNFAKGEMTGFEFVEWVTRVANHLAASLPKSWPELLADRPEPESDRQGVLAPTIR